VSQKLGKQKATRASCDALRKKNNWWEENEDANSWIVLGCNSAKQDR